MCGESSSTLYVMLSNSHCHFFASPIAGSALFPLSPYVEFLKTRNMMVMSSQMPIEDQAMVSHAGGALIASGYRGESPSGFYSQSSNYKLAGDPRCNLSSGTGRETVAVSPGT